MYAAYTLKFRCHRSSILSLAVASSRRSLCHACVPKDRDRVPPRVAFITSKPSSPCPISAHASDVLLYVDVLPRPTRQSKMRLFCPTTAVVGTR